MKGNKGLIPSKRLVGNDLATTSNQWQSNPKQQLFLKNYFDPSSTTFGNVFRSAINAGYSESYSRTLTRRSNKNMWLTDYLNQNTLLPEHITAGITSIALNGVRDSDKLKAYKLLAELKGLLIDKSITAHVNLEQVINDLK